MLRALIHETNVEAKKDNSLKLLTTNVIDLKI
jgi:hypothetical protein